MQKATLVVQSEVDKCVEDIMKEKKINSEKDARYALFTVFSFIVHFYCEVWRSHTVNCKNIGAEGIVEIIQFNPFTSLDEELRKCFLNRHMNCKLYFIVIRYDF